MQVYFDHERLDVYQAGRELNRELAGISRELPKGSAESADNLTRAGKSITRNIAEGSSKGTVADRNKHFRISRGSASEVPASLDELVDCGLIPEARVARARTLAHRIVSMLINLMRATQEMDEPARIPPKRNTVSGNHVHVLVDPARARPLGEDPEN